MDVESNSSFDHVHKRINDDLKEILDVDPEKTQVSEPGSRKMASTGHIKRNDSPFVFT